MNLVKSICGRVIGGIVILLIILIILGFFIGVGYLRIWSCQDLHPGASALGCILAGGRN